MVRRVRVRAANVWWRCAQYFVTSCGHMPRDNRCIFIYMMHVCFYVCYSDCVGSVGLVVV